MTNEEKLKKLKSIYQLVDESISKKEFETAFASLIDFIKKAKENLNEIIVKAINFAKSEMKAEYEALKSETEADLSNLTAKYDKSIGQALKEQENGLNFIRDKVRKIKEGKNGKDGQTPIKGVDYFDGKNVDENAIIEKLRLNPEDIRNKLEKLENDERLDKSAIKGLEEELEKLRQFRGRSLGGGGFSVSSFNIHVVDDETPVNSGDDLTFTIVHTPSPASSLKLYRNGQRLRIVEDFTLSGKNITLLIALTAGEILLCDYRI